MGFFSAIGNAVSGAVSGIIDTVVGEDSLIGKVASGLGLDNVTDLILGGPGQWLETITDAVGLPPIVGDVLNCITNVATGNIPGAISEAMEAASQIAVAVGAEKLGQFLELGKNLVSPFTSGNPSEFFKGAMDNIKDTITDPQKLLKFLGDAVAPQPYGDLFHPLVFPEQSTPEVWKSIFDDVAKLIENSEPALRQLRA